MWLFLYFLPLQASLECFWNHNGLITIITNWNRMIVWPKVDACLTHDGYLVHNIVDLNIANCHTRRGILAIPTNNYWMCRCDMCRLKGIIHYTFPMNLIDFSISHLTKAIFNHATQMTITSCLFKCQCIVIFYVGGFHSTPKGGHHVSYPYFASTLSY
jgi:hypothetical protein